MACRGRQKSRAMALFMGHEILKTALATVYNPDNKNQHSNCGLKRYSHSPGVLSGLSFCVAIVFYFLP
jgi:hypothetical protein